METWLRRVRSRSSSWHIIDLSPKELLADVGHSFNRDCPLSYTSGLHFYALRLELQRDSLPSPYRRERERVFRFITRSLSPRHTENRENFRNVVHTIFAPIPLHWKIGQIFYPLSRFFWTRSNNIIESFNILKQKSYDFTFKKSWFENLSNRRSRILNFRDYIIFPKEIEISIADQHFD